MNHMEKKMLKLAKIIIASTKATGINQIKANRS